MSDEPILPRLLTVAAAATIAGMPRARMRHLVDEGLVTSEASGRVHRASLEQHLGRRITAADIFAADREREPARAYQRRYWHDNAPA